MNTSAAVTQLNQVYNTTMSNGGDTITIAFNFTAVSGSGDIDITWFTSAQIRNLRSQGNWPAAGQMPFGSKTMMLSQQYWNFRSLTIPHEFGHGLGLRHAPLGGESIMSYYPYRNLQWKDAVNIRNQFICGSSC